MSSLWEGRHYHLGGGPYDYKNQLVTQMKYLKINDSGEGLKVSRGGESKGNHKEKKFMSKSKSKAFDNSKYKCFICHKN